MILTANKNFTPFVSIIVPVYNDETRIGTCIKALLRQTYPAVNLEIIIVDNCSTDRTLDKIKHFPIKILHENNIQSSYAARNKGIIHARGEIIAFTDSDCTPVAEWLAEGIKAFQKKSVDITSGNVRFTFSSDKTGAEIYDSLTNMQIEENIIRRKVSKTANLFVRSVVFKKIGFFPSRLQSGGDVIWTGLATKNGYNLVYTHRAEVSHPARKLRALMKKQYRVGKGQSQILAKADNSLLKNLLKILFQLSPIQILTIPIWLKKRKTDITKTQIFRVCMAAYLCRLSNFCGNVVSLSDLWKP
jgi:glycosyltransferase involved in cell wall biosynthesis